MGIGSSKSYNPEVDIPDLSGKVAIVTGGNVGIGYYTVQQLVRHGAKVYMGARNESRAVGAIAQLEAEGLGKGSVHWLPLDLASPSSTQRAAKDFLAKESRLDILINNAAMVLNTGEHRNIDAKTPISEIMSTNHLGPFIFTTTLLPILEATALEPGADVRVITLSSMVFRHVPSTDWKDMSVWKSKANTQSVYATQMSYATTKLASVLFTRELQARLDAKGSSVLSIAVHPGSAFTLGAQKFLSVMLTRWFTPILGLFFKTPAEGAFTSLYASTAPDVRKNPSAWKGAYVVPVGVIENVAPTGNVSPQAQKDLWSMSEEIARQNLT